MTIQQISVFLENKFGRLNEILGMISGSGVRVISATVSDTTEFGILRMIVSDPYKTFEMLKNNQVSANLSEVFAVETDASSDQLAQIVQCFTCAGISIEYMYSFSTKEKGVLIFRLNNMDAAREVIRKNKIQNLGSVHLIDL